MNINAFREIGTTERAIAVVDARSGAVHGASGTFLGRVVRHVREAFGAEKMLIAPAHNRFLMAISQARSGYSSADAVHAREMLADDAAVGKPLTGRKIREVLNELDGRSSASERVERRLTAYREANPGVLPGPAAPSVTEELARRMSHTQSVTQEQRPASAETPHSAPRHTQAQASAEAGQQGNTGSEVETPSTVQASRTEQTSTAAQANAGAGVETPSRAQAGNAEQTIGAAQAQVTHTPETEQSQSPRTAQEAPQTQEASPKQTSSKALRSTLSKAGLPKEVDGSLRAQIKSGTIVDASALAREGNRALADWAVENRLGKWYIEALGDRGAAQTAKRSGMVDVPKTMTSTVRNAIAQSPALRDYADVKVHARDLIAGEIRREQER